MARTCPPAATSDVHPMSGKKVIRRPLAPSNGKDPKPRALPAMAGPSAVGLLDLEGHLAARPFSQGSQTPPLPGYSRAYVEPNLGGTVLDAPDPAVQEPPVVPLPVLIKPAEKR